MSRLVSADLYPVKGMRAATAYGSPPESLMATAKGFTFQGIGNRMLYPVARSRQTGELTVITPRGRDSATGREHVHPRDRALKRADVEILDELLLQLSAEGVDPVTVDLRRVQQGKPVRAALHKGEVWGFDLGLAP